MKRISVTTLECYRKFLYEASDFATEQSVIDAVKGIYTGRPEYAAIGSAFHEIVERGLDCVRKDEDKCIVTIDDHDIIFSQKQVDIALKYRNRMDYATHEYPISKVFHTRTMDILVEARVDLIHGIFVRDIKTKYSSIVYKDYAESAQWKFYLELTGLDYFYFDLFSFKGYKPDKHGYDVSELELVPEYSIECLRYENMLKDNQSLVENFVDFCEKRDLIQYLKETKD